MSAKVAVVALSLPFFLAACLNDKGRSYRATPLSYAKVSAEEAAAQCSNELQQVNKQSDPLKVLTKNLIAPDQEFTICMKSKGYAVEPADQ